MMYAVLSLGLALLGGIVRLAQVLTVVCAAAVRCTGNHGIPPVVSGPYRSGGRHFPCAGGSCGAVMGGDADSSGAGDDLVK